MKSRRIRAPFVTTVASVVLAGAALSGSACGPNPPELDDCPLDRPSNGDRCHRKGTCYYDNDTGCSSSSWTRATCVDGEWEVRSGGSSCNPPMPFDSGNVEVSTDASSDPDSAACPKNEPAIGATCDAAMTCSYENLCPQTSSFATNTYRCVSGKWSFDMTLESPIDCPKVEPRDGAACGCAMYLPSKCSYAGSCGATDAVCDGATQKWIVKAATCADAGDDAPASETEPTPDAGEETTSDAAAD